MTEYIFEDESGQETVKNFDNIVQAKKYAKELETRTGRKISIGISAVGFDPGLCAMFAGP